MKWTQKKHIELEFEVDTANNGAQNNKNTARSCRDRNFILSNEYLH